MIERLSRVKRNFVLALILALVVWFGWTIRSVLNPVLLGYLCAYVLHPFVLRIERLGVSRRTAVNVTFVAGLLAAFVVGLLLVVQVRSLALEVYRSAQSDSAPSESEQEAGGETESEAGEDPVQPLDEDPAQGAESEKEGSVRGFAERMDARFEEFRESVAEYGIELPPVSLELEDLQASARSLLEQYEEDTAALGLDAAERGIRFVTRFLGRMLALAGMFVLLPLYAYYFLFVQKDMHAFVRRYLPKRERERVARVAADVGQVIANFFRGRLGVCFLKGLFLSAGLWIADVDYAFLFGMLSGFLSVIPFFGPFLGFLLAFFVGILEHGVVASLVRTGIVFGAGELLEGYVLVPKVLGDSLGLHPLVVFVALLAGGAALGMLGVLIALPLTAALVIVVKEFVLPALEDFADEDPEPV